MSIILALSANMIFAFSSTLFTDFSREVSGKWINCFKLCVAFICFSVMGLIARDGIAHATIPIYILSGAIGLFMADHFLCEAFAKIGSARTLMIFSFAPLFVAFWCYLFFNETLPLQKFIAIIFFMACVMTLGFEKFREAGHWQISGLVMAFCGIVLDGLANVVTSYGFRLAPTNGVFSVCAFRALGAFVAFLLVSPFLKINLLGSYLKLDKRKRALVVLASFLGTFLSLTLWINAVKMGNLTTLIALSGMTPLMAAVFEILRGKTRFSKYLALAFGFFAIGFYFLVIR